MGGVRGATYLRGNVMSAVTVETKGAISIIRINRPERLNAINQDVAVELQQAFKAFDADDSQRVAVLSSVGERAFSSGADVSNLPELWRAIPTVGYDTEKPIIAATTGWVIGGAIVMVMMCDLMVSTERHHVLLSGGETWHHGGRHQFAGHAHAAQARHGDHAAGVEGSGATRVRRWLRQPGRSEWRT